MKNSKFIISDHVSHEFSGAVSLYCCQFSVNEYMDDVFLQHQIFFPAEIEKSVASRKAEFFAGRYCAKKSMLLLDGTTATIHIGNHRNPLWPSHMVGSISHCKFHAAAITALKSNIRGIGIDIQDEIDMHTYVQIRDQIIFKSERNIISQINQSLTELEVFTIIFSVKESFFKATFEEVGRYFDFSSVSILRIDHMEKQILIRVNETLSENIVAGIEVQAEYRIIPDKGVITLVRLDQLAIKNFTIS